MRSVYDFSSYRDFLRFFYENLRKENTGFSLAQLAKKVKMSPSTLKMILAGRRNLTLERMHTLSKALNLSSSEQEYFEALVYREQIKNSEHSKTLAKKVQTAKLKAKLNTISLSQKELLSNPFILPVLVYLTDILPDAITSELDFFSYVPVLAQKFNIEPNTIKAIIEKLISSGVLLKEKSPTETHYVFNRLGHIFNQKQYLKKWLIESEKRIETDYTNEVTLFSATSIALPEESLLDFKLEMKNLLEKYLALPASGKSKKTIVQACVQIFPITKS